MSASAMQGGHNNQLPMHQKHTTQNKLKRLEPRFGDLLRPLAWKQRGPILKGKGK